MQNPVLISHLYFDAFLGLINSSGFTAIVGAGLATMVGALAAQRIATDSADKAQLLKEIRDVNQAITLAFSVVNALGSLKKQIIRGLTNEYFASRLQFEQSLLKKRQYLHVPNEPIRVQGNFLSFEVTTIPAAALEHLLMERISTKTRPLATFSSLREAYQNLTSAVAVRQSILNEFRAEFLPLVYFGIKNGANHDMRYFNSMQGIRSYTDDGIFFGKLLCEDLQNYGIELSTKYRQTFKEDPPEVVRLSFERAILEGLIPFNFDYKDWLDGFSTPRPKVGQCQKIANKFLLYSLFVIPCLPPGLILDTLFLTAVIPIILF